MQGSNKLVNATTDYVEVCRRFHEAGIMINGSFVFGFDCDAPDVFERTVEFTVENKILTASFHILTPLPGTRLFERLESESRILHRNWSLYDTYHAVFRPAPHDARATGDGLQPSQEPVCLLEFHCPPVVGVARRLEAVCL